MVWKQDTRLLTTAMAVFALHFMEHFVAVAFTPFLWSLIALVRRARCVIRLRSGPANANTVDWAYRAAACDRNRSLHSAVGAGMGQWFVRTPGRSDGHPRHAGMRRASYTL